MAQQAQDVAEPLPALGIIMLNTRFPRVVGDIGNPETFPFPVRYRIVEQATVGQVVRADGLSAALVDGFVAICQKELARRCPLPMIASSLCQVPLVQAALPAGRRVGVLTIDARKLTPAHFAAVGAAADTPFVGTEGGAELTRVIEQDLPELDPAEACRDVLQAGEALLAQAPDVGAIVLECTNMAPYARALAAHLGLPVFDILSLLAWWHRSLSPPRF